MAHTRPAGWYCALVFTCVAGILSLTGFVGRASAQTDSPAESVSPSSLKSQTLPPETIAHPADKKPQGTDSAQPDSQPAPPTKPTIRRPNAAQRIVKTFHFDDRISSAIDTPEGWVRAQNDEKVPRIRPGFPIWNGAKIDFRVAAQGKGSVRMPIDGGSASLRLKTGELPIFAGAKYTVRVMVRAEGMVYARPRIVVRALDAQGEPIPESQRSLVIMHPTKDWQPVQVQLPGIFKNAAYMQIDLEVVQEREFRKPTMGEHQLWHEDFNTSAWFDELTVLQVPQVTLATTSPLNIITRPNAPIITATVRDLAAQDMIASFQLYDATRTLVDSSMEPITTGKATLTWKPTISELGWYRVNLEISADQSIIAKKTSDFVWLDQPVHASQQHQPNPAATGKNIDADRNAHLVNPFGLTLSELPPVSVTNLQQVLENSGVSAVTLPVWETSLTTSNANQRIDLLREMIDSLHQTWITPTLSLPVVPDELAKTLRIQSTDVLGSLQAPESVWGPYLLRAMDRLGNTDASWQIGSTLAPSTTKDPAYQSKLTAVHTQLAKLVPSLMLELAWRADQSPTFLDASGIRSVRIGVPSWLSAKGMKPLIETWHTQPQTLSPTYVFEADDTASHHERDAAADFARRFVTFWIGLTEPTPATSAQNTTAPIHTGVSLANPWITVQGDHPSTNPHASLAVWRQLADRFTGRVFATKWNIAPEVECSIFTPAPDAKKNRGCLIVLWNKTAKPDPASFDLQPTLIASLGQDDITIYDIFGNRQAVSPTTTPDNPRSEYHIQFGSEPIFIEGADTNLVLFLASIALDPPTIESASGEHVHDIILHNPWPIPITGKLIISKPGGYDIQTQSRDRSWKIAPHAIDFSIPAKGTVRYPIVLSFSQSIESGPQPFIFDIKLISDKQYNWAQIIITSAIQWHGILFDLAHHPAKNTLGTDLVIEASITNLSNEPRSLEATAFAPNLPRQRTNIGTLQPGQSIIRRFVFADGYETLAGQKIFVALSDPSNTDRQNKSITLPATAP